MKRFATTEPAGAIRARLPRRSGYWTRSAANPFPLFRFSMPVLLAGLAMVAFPALAQDAPKADAEAKKPAEPPAELASPAATLDTFLTHMERLKQDKSDSAAWEQVFSTLDAPRVAGDLRRNQAWRLAEILKKLGPIDPARMAPDKHAVEMEELTRFEFFPKNPNQAAQQLIARVSGKSPTPPGKIVLVKTADGSWKFGSETLNAINQLAVWIGAEGVHSLSGWLRTQMPGILKGHFFLTLEYWQWVALFLLIFVTVVADHLSRYIFRGVVRRLTRRFLGEPDERDLWFAVRPMGVSVGALCFLLLLNMVGLSGTALTILTVAGQVVFVVGITWVAWAITDLIAAVLLEKAKSTDTEFDDMVIPLVRKTAKLCIIAMGLLYVADVFEIEMAPLLGGLGLAGLAISFAAQDIVKNLFGGVMIFLDRPFVIGERINYGGYDGVVEEIGFRTTRVRTLTGHVVTIPNGSITNDPVENIARRPYIRRTLNVTITYDTPREKIEQAVQIIRDLLEEEGLREPIHATIGGNDYPPRVYFNDYNAESLNIIVLYWFTPPAYWDFLEHGQRFNLRLFEEYERAGIEFAFPTQTLYLAGDPNRELAVKMLAADLPG